MTIPNNCPHCGAGNWQNGRWECGTESVSTSRTKLCKLNEAAKAVCEDKANTNIRWLKREVLQ